MQGLHYLSCCHHQLANTHTYVCTHALCTHMHMCVNFMHVSVLHMDILLCPRP